jgi:hypothetical protein
MAETQKRNQRSVWNSFRVEQGFKQRQILRLLLLTMLNVLVSTGAFVAFHNYELTTAHSSGLYVQPLPSVVRIAIVWAALMAGLGGLFALMTGLLMTHRMAGPIHNFKQERGDEFADVALALNGALEALWIRSGASASEGALALDLDSIRAVHVEILEGLETFDLSALPEQERRQAEAWREQMLDLESKLNT